MRKSSISTRGYDKIHIQRPFLDIEKGIWKINVLLMYTCFGVLSTPGSCFMKKTKISIFGGISKFLELIVCG
jgi:hypothetical protein